MRRIRDELKWWAWVALVLLFVLAWWCGSYAAWLAGTIVGLVAPSWRRRRQDDEDEDDDDF
jgi:hypothetical protein